jgi:predicted nucleic acid-binding protein
MAVLVDTNILLRMAQPVHPHCRLARGSVAVFRGRGETQYLAAQNLMEFWCVATRPAGENGLGLTSDAANFELTRIQAVFVLLPETPLFDEWRRLVTTCRVSGKTTHDARLVAAMLANGISKILTFNVQDFVRFPEIEVLHPEAVTS